jgi:hypothetical protein
MPKQNLKHVLSLLALSASACAWSTFDDIESKAPVRTYEAPGSYRREDFGAVVATFHGKIRGETVSRMMASAGPDSPIVIERMWTGAALDSGSNIRCKGAKDCSKGAGVGSVLVPFDTWGRGTKQEQTGCLYTPGFPNAYVFCETNPGSNPTFKLGFSEAKAQTRQFSGAQLPSDHPLGIALVGSHLVSNRTKEATQGALYYQPDLVELGPPLRELALLDPRTQVPFSQAEDAGDLGFAVAAMENGEGELVIAVSQPSHNRVIVATFDPRIPVDPAIENPVEQLNLRTRTRACLNTEDPSLAGIGKRLAIGDINGDEEPEIFVGIDPFDDKNEGKQRVWMYPGQGLPAFDGERDVCPLWDVDPVQVGCIDGVRGVDCEATAFGASMAVGDVNGDGFGDLIVGAPHADVQGESKAGVAWLIPGSNADESGGLDFENITNLYASNFKAGGLAGTSVAAVRTDDRDEPIVGAPGTNSVYMFLCSKIETGVSSDNLCLPK